jgi:hypothetical protein
MLTKCWSNKSRKISKIGVVEVLTGRPSERLLEYTSYSKVSV